MAVFLKIATLKVKNGTYKKDGVEKNSYHEVGVLLSSPHGSQLVVKMHATATSEPKLISVYMDEGVKLSLNREEKAEAPASDYAPTADEVPFQKGIMKKVVEDFLLLVIDEYPLDQLALLVTWMNESEDEIDYFTRWLDLGEKVDSLIREFEIDLNELLDDAMAEKRRRMDEAAQEELDRYYDLNGIRR